ncbi:hypothetical protein AAE02nite_22580 [Adhaeribacter aerolatus]|uniref:Uncharacterized protein n=2 Tax=Adhaeribacter aerolatus TaxID=670289 RepID=A0A512AY09_9BACT|nr:hypothetical protein AAE02nite_22580 [Adhaeribacter aerolatus]
MQGLEFTIFEDLDVTELSLEEVQDCLFYLEHLLENEESPIEFIRYQSYKVKLLNRLKEVKQR